MKCSAAHAAFAKRRAALAINHAASKVALAIMTLRKEVCLPLRAPICRARGFCKKAHRPCYEILCASKITFCASAPHLRIPALMRKGECAGATTVATARAEENRTQSLWRTLGFPSTHDFYQLPQPLAKKICFAKIFCEEEERAFSAYCPALPNSRVVRSVPTTSVRKETCEPFYSFPSDCGVTEKVLEMPSRA